MTLPITTIESLSKTYNLGSTKVKALDTVSFSISMSDFVAFVGPSGSGKTTLMNMLGLIDSPDTGEIRIDGHEIRNLSDQQLTGFRLEKMGFIFQSFNLMPILNVWENVELPMLLGQSIMSKKERRDWVNELVDRVGLSSWANHKPSELSGGQRQRVAIARALVNNPKLVLADEPTANLDSATGEKILSEMKRINSELGTTFVFSTHDAMIRNMADHVIILQDGRIVSDTAIKAAR